MKQFTFYVTGMHRPPSNNFFNVIDANEEDANQQLCDHFYNNEIVITSIECVDVCDAQEYMRYIEEVNLTESQCQYLKDAYTRINMERSGAIGCIGDVNSKEKGSGARYNPGKPDYSLIPFFTLEDEARVWEFGKIKYAEWNWTKGMKWSIPFSSLIRHMSDWQRGEECDQESGLPHLAHAMCNLRMLTLYAKNYIEGDDRPKEELK